MRGLVPGSFALLVVVVAGLSSACLDGGGEATPTRTAPEEKVGGSDDCTVRSTFRVWLREPPARGQPAGDQILTWPLPWDEGLPIPFSASKETRYRRPPRRSSRFTPRIERATPTGTRRSGQWTRGTTGRSSSVVAGSIRRVRSGLWCLPERRADRSGEFASFTCLPSGQSPGVMACRSRSCPALVAMHSRSMERHSAR
jgi:hypothetical protein